MKHRLLALIVCALIQTLVLGSADRFEPRHNTVLVSLAPSDDPARIVKVLDALPKPPRHVKVTSVGGDRNWLEFPALFVCLMILSAIIIGLYHLSEWIVNRFIVLKKTRHAS